MPTEPNRDENQRLERAIRGADDLLRDSLQRAERKRRLERDISVGCVIAAAVIGIAAIVMVQHEPEPSAVSAPPAPMTPVIDARKPVPQAGRVELTNREIGIDLNHGRPDEALEKAVQLTNLYPQNPAAWHALGDLHWNLGNFEGAQKAFQMALQLDENHRGAWYGLAQVAWSAGRLQDVEQHLLKAAARSSEDRSATYPTPGVIRPALVHLYLSQERFDEAAQWAIKAGGIRDDWLQAIKERKLSEAMRAEFEHYALERSANWRKAVMAASKGWRLMSFNNYDAAAEQFQSALQHEPRVLPNHVRGNARNAPVEPHIKSLEQVRDLPQFPAGHRLCLVQLYLGSRQYDKAIDELRVLLEADPDNPGLRHQLEYAQKQPRESPPTDDRPQKIRIWENGEKHAGPRPNKITALLADAYFDHGDYTKAVEYYTLLVDANPNDPQLAAKLEAARQKAAANERPANNAEPAL